MIKLKGYIFYSLNPFNVIDFTVYIVTFSPFLLPEKNYNYRIGMKLGDIVIVVDYKESKIS